VVKGLAEKDMPMVQQGHYTSGMYTYMDDVEKLGLTLELLENFNKQIIVLMKRINAA
jgi:hypothetical protein